MATRLASSCGRPQNNEWHISCLRANNMMHRLGFYTCAIACCGSAFLSSVLSACGSTTDSNPSKGTDAGADAGTDAMVLEGGAGCGDAGSHTCDVSMLASGALQCKTWGSKRPDGGLTSCPASFDWLNIAGDPDHECKYEWPYEPNRSGLPNICSLPTSPAGASPFTWLEPLCGDAGCP